MTITIDSKSVLTFIVYLMTALAGSDALGYFQILNMGAPNKIIAVLGLAGIVVQGAAFAWGLKKPAAPVVDPVTGLYPGQNVPTVK